MMGIVGFRTGGSRGSDFELLVSHVRVPITIAAVRMYQSLLDSEPNILSI